MHQSTFCMRCNQRVRSPNHLCQPSAVKKHRAIQQFEKRRQEKASSR
jgi:hypothetical protein